MSNVYCVCETDLTPWACRYSTVFVMVCRTALASLSEKNFCLKILSSSSPPLINSVTRYIDRPSSNTYKPTKTQNNRRQNMGRSSYKCPTGTQTITHVFQSDDVGMLSITQQNLNLLCWISPILTYNLQSNQNH